jgi:hypothetical protein
MSEETKPREAVCRFAKSLFDRGLTGGASGNISARLPDDNLPVTPTGASFGWLAPGRPAKIDSREMLVGGDSPTKEMPLHAADQAAKHGMGVLIEPSNTRDVPGYFLSDLNTAVEIVHSTQREEIRIPPDCYHAAAMRVDIVSWIRDPLELTGHVRFAAFPDRNEPDRGALDYSRLLPEIVSLGYDRHFGAEYRPGGKTAESLGWMNQFR